MQRLNDHNEQLMEHKNKIRELKEEKLRIEKSVQEQKSLEDKKEELELSNENLIADVTESEMKIEPISVSSFCIVKILKVHSSIYRRPGREEPLLR